MATVPDPLDSGAQYQFDGDVEALQVAAELVYQRARQRRKQTVTVPKTPETAPISSRTRSRECRKEAGNQTVSNTEEKWCSEVMVPRAKAPKVCCTTPGPASSA